MGAAPRDFFIDPKHAVTWPVGTPYAGATPTTVDGILVTAHRWPAYLGHSFALHLLEEDAAFLALQGIAIRPARHRGIV